jgi:hypothetical protein
MKKVTRNKKTKAFQMLSAAHSAEQPRRLGKLPGCMGRRSYYGKTARWWQKNHELPDCSHQIFLGYKA